MGYLLNAIYLFYAFVVVFTAGIAAYRTRRAFMGLLFLAASVAFVGAIMREYSINEVRTHLVEDSGEEVEQRRLLPAKQPWYRVSFYMFPTAHLLAITGCVAYLWDTRRRDP